VECEDQLSLAIGKHGQNVRLAASVRLAARLTGWDIDILTPDEYNKEVECLAASLKDVEEVDDTFVDKLLALGIISVLDMEEVGTEPLVSELGLDTEPAEKVVAAASEEAKRMASEKSKKQAEDIMEQEQAEQEQQQDLQ
jgi:N utilization substance protein A